MHVLTMGATVCQVSSRARVSKYFPFGAYIKIDAVSCFQTYWTMLPRLMKPVFLNWTKLANCEESNLR